MSDDKTRTWVGEATIFGSFVALIAISIVLLWFPQSEGAKTLFNSVLPLLGTWIGTVLAFYFSRANFATAAAVYKDVAAGAGSLPTTSVTAAMIDKSKLVSVVIPANDPRDLKLQSEFLSKTTATITRFPVLDPNGAVKYIIHASSLYEFAYTLQSAPGGGVTLATATLADFLQQAAGAKLATAFAIVSSSSALSDAKQKMDATPGCADVFVTNTGAPSEPMLGWITDTILASYASV